MGFVIFFLREVKEIHFHHYSFSPLLPKATIVSSVPVMKETWQILVEGINVPDFTSYKESFFVRIRLKSGSYSQKKKFDNYLSGQTPSSTQKSWTELLSP